MCCASNINYCEDMVALTKTTHVGRLMPECTCHGVNVTIFLTVKIGVSWRVLGLLLDLILTRVY